MQLETLMSLMDSTFRILFKVPLQFTARLIKGGLCALLVAVLVLSGSAKDLVRLSECKLVQTEWADGDSFLVSSPDRGEFTLRLYGADCIEWHVTDASDERRLRAQRRYFGITKARRDPREAIALAKSFGETAAKEIQTLLAEPFTVHTAFADARGDGRHQRIYGFVTTSKGKDLATELVSLGLARAFGVYRQTYDGRSQMEYREHLRDLEFLAAKKGTGIWHETNWEALPEERRTQREEDRQIEMSIDGNSGLSGRKIDPNRAARDELMALPGIGEELANRIIEGRPYSKPEDLQRVSGIGPSKLSKIMPHLQFSAR